MNDVKTKWDRLGGTDADHRRVTFFWVVMWAVIVFLVTEAIFRFTPLDTETIGSWVFKTINLW